jgi:uncharacterized lipoprotein YddW (UPF0748 family)
MILASLVVLLTTAAIFVALRTDPGVVTAPSEAVPASGTCDGIPTQAPRELRGMWVATVDNIDWPSKAGLDEASVKAEYLGWLDLAQRLHHNAIFVQIRPSGDTFWPSQYAPWSQWLTGRTDGSSPGWDPLAWMIQQTHARNIEFHAWLNPYKGDQQVPQGPSFDLSTLAANDPLRLHPDWAVAYPIGTDDSKLYFDPGIPAAREYIEQSMLEVVQKYDIDGVDFDDFFYPYPEDGQDFNDVRSFALFSPGFNDKGDWRRHNVNLLVREMDQKIKAIKPWVTFGISPFGIWRNSSTDPSGSATHGLQSFDQIYADSRTWVQQHWVDYIMPQLYWQIGNPPADFAVLIKWWSQVVAGTGVQLYPAFADYRVGDDGAWSNPDELSKQFALARQYNVQGTVHYDAVSMRADKLGAISRYTSTYYPTPALLPDMARLPSHPPAAPVITSAVNGSVTWRPGPGLPPTSFAVYRHDPGAATATLVATVRTTSYVDSAAPDGARFCVSGLDRTDHEGLVAQPLGRPVAQPTVTSR